MAQIYKKVMEGPGRGRDLVQAMGLHADVQERLHTEAELGAFRAEANLLQLRAKPTYDRSGNHSEIKVEHGKIDWYVILDDDRGLKAALSIEYGRKAAGISSDPGNIDGSIMGDAGMEGAYILHDAMKLGRGAGIGKADIGEAFDE